MRYHIYECRSGHYYIVMTYDVYAGMSKVYYYCNLLPKDDVCIIFYLSTDRFHIIIIPVAAAVAVLYFLSAIARSGIHVSMSG